MTKPSISFGGVRLGLTSEPTGAEPVPDAGTPFRILLLADFSGRAARGIRETGAKLASRRPIRIDRDNFEEVMAKLSVEIPANLPGLREPALCFREMDDFLPDRIYSRLNVFGILQRTRQRLQNPSIFAAAVEEAKRWAQASETGETAEESESPGGPAPPLANLSPEDLLSQMLGETSANGPRSAPKSQPSPAGGLDFNEMIQNIAAPYAVPSADPCQAKLVAAVDAAMTAHMRALLHHPLFQELEAAWRAAFFVVRNLNTDSQLQVFLLDVSRVELAADLEAVEDLGASGIYRILVEQTVGTLGAHPWAVVAGNYTFDQERADVEFLGRLAQISACAGAPFLAGASPHVVGCESFGATPDPRDWQRPSDPEGSAAWQVLRKLPAASSLGLALPRFLLRLPYGKASSPVEAFDFQELTDPPQHEHFLWGNPAFAAVYLVGEAFSRHGWKLQPGVVRDVGGLPTPVYEEDGEKQLKPCAEALLTDRAAEALLNQGLMPLLSIKGSDRVSLVRFQSLADPPAPLKGRWKSS